nr:hypothetical protein [uncultured Gellertiella sp.]
MVAGVLRLAPDTGQAKLATSTIIVPDGTLHLAPCVTAANINSPALCFRVTQGILDLGVLMPSPHRDLSSIIGNYTKLSTDNFTLALTN